MNSQAVARACSNIAFIKYWGNQDHTLRLPSNPSISMNLDALYTTTTVQWDARKTDHTLRLNGEDVTDARLERVAGFIEFFKAHYQVTGAAAVTSENNFPIGTGIASSASAFAALAAATSRAAGLDLEMGDLSALARVGSGSASRSVPGGFVTWQTGNTHESSVATSFAPADHWDLVDVIAIVSQTHKAIGSSQGHRIAETSDLQASRVAGAPQRFETCRQAILDRDFDKFAAVVEQDSNIMHAVMMTSHPALFYWLPASLEIMHQVRAWRGQGLEVCYTLDAGPNVHCICAAKDAEEVHKRLQQINGIMSIKTASPGPGVQIID